ncbi:MAG: DNA internalization-related competence protein ComEC/Rec2 [Gammaproteobacteria bacterium]
MPAIAVIFLVGILAGFTVRTPGPEVVAGLIIVPGLACWWLGGRVPLALLFGFVLSALTTHAFDEHSLGDISEPLEMTVQGIISDIPVAHSQGVSFTFEITGQGYGDSVTEHLRLSIYRLAIRPQAGESWQFLVRLKPVHGQVNPGTFDRASWLFAADVHAYGYVVDSPLTRRLASESGPLSILSLRRELRSRLQLLLGDDAVLPLLTAITMGYRGDFTAGDWELLRKTGTSHLMAISGLHVGLVAMIFWNAGRIVGQFSAGFLPGCLPFILALSGAFFYSLLAGMAVSTTRALIMIAVFMMVVIRNRSYAPVCVISIAVLLVLCMQSKELLSAAFWLSFSAVTLLLTLCTARKVRTDSYSLNKRLKKIVWAQCILCIGLAAPVAIFFSEIPPASIVANLIAVPVFSVITIPAALMGALFSFLSDSIAILLLELAAGSLLFLIRMLNALAELPVINLYGLLPSVFLLVPCIAMTLTGVVLRSAGILGGSIVLFMLASSAGRFYDNGFEMHVLDVGQGLAVILQVNDHVLVYDTGPSWPGGDSSRSVIIPALRRLGIRRIDNVLVSHGDNDHVGGYKSLVSAYEPERVISAQQAIQGAHVISCRKGMFWQWEDVRFEVLHPRQPETWDENNGSCVLQVSIGDYNLLLPGDIEADAELVLSSRDILQPAQLLIAPHHGSQTSSSRIFVDSLRPDQVIFATGYLNRWGFPAYEVSARWQQAGACLFNTAISGALRIQFSHAEGFRVVEQAAKSFWRPWPLRPAASSQCLNML